MTCFRVKCREIASLFFFFFPPHGKNKLQGWEEQTEVGRLTLGRRELEGWALPTWVPSAAICPIWGLHQPDLPAPVWPPASAIRNGAPFQRVFGSKQFKGQREVPGRWWQFKTHCPLDAAVSLSQPLCISQPQTYWAWLLIMKHFFF